MIPAKKWDVLLSSLAAGARITDACAAADIPRTYFYHHKQNNTKFAKQVDEAISSRADFIEDELFSMGQVDIGEAFDKAGKLLPVHQMPERVRRALSSIEVEELYAGRGKSRVKIGVVRKIRLHDKVRALEVSAKKYRIFPDAVDARMQIPPEIASAPDDELIKRVQAARDQDKRAAADGK